MSNKDKNSSATVNLKKQFEEMNDTQRVNHLGELLVNVLTVNKGQHTELSAHRSIVPQLKQMHTELQKQLEKTQSGLVRLAQICGMTQFEGEVPDIEMLIEHFQKSKASHAMKMNLLEAYEKANAQHSVNTESSISEPIKTLRRQLAIATSCMKTLRQQNKDNELKLIRCETSIKEVQSKFRKSCSENVFPLAALSNKSEIEEITSVFEAQIKALEDALVKKNEINEERINAINGSHRDSLASLTKLYDSCGEKVELLEGKVKRMGSELTEKDQSMIATSKTHGEFIASLEASQKQEIMDSTEFHRKTIAVLNETHRDSISSMATLYNSRGEEIARLEGELSQAKNTIASAERCIFEHQLREGDMKIELENQKKKRQSITTTSTYEENSAIHEKNKTKALRLSLGTALFYVFQLVLAVMAVTMGLGLHPSLRPVPIASNSTLKPFHDPTTEWTHIDSDTTELETTGSRYTLTETGDETYETDYVDLPLRSLIDMEGDWSARADGGGDEEPNGSAQNTIIRVFDIALVVGAVSWVGWKVLRGGNRGLAGRV